MSHFLSFVKIGAQRPPAVFGSGIRTLPFALSWVYYPFPAIPLHPPPITCPSPIHLDLPLLKIFFIGPRVRAQVVMKVMGTSAALGGWVNFRVVWSAFPVRGGDKVGQGGGIIAHGRYPITRFNRIVLVTGHTPRSPRGAEYWTRQCSKRSISSSLQRARA